MIPHFLDSYIILGIDLLLMSKSEDFYALLFEVSNEDRDRILCSLHEEKKRVTDISRELDLDYTEIRRHISRLHDIGLIQRDLDGTYHLTPYGETCLIYFKDLNFISSNREYFGTHSPVNIPLIFLKRLSELSKYQFVDNFMGFLIFIDEKIKEAKEFVSLFIDQYPLIAVDSLLNAVERGVKVRIIEQRDLSGPTVEFEDKHILPFESENPDVMVKVYDRKDVYLFISDAGSAISFPNKDGFDYSGFTVTDKESGSWSEDLFNHYWENAQHKMPISINPFTPVTKNKGKTITVTANTDPVLNSHAIQNAVDNYDEVILRGEFTVAETGMQMFIGGMSSTIIKIRKSVVIRGDGREDNIPSTKIKKKSWKFPFNDYMSIFEIDNEDIDVTIENIHFQDFNWGCITASRGKSVQILNNRITLTNGLGRGRTDPHVGDGIIGINVWNPDQEQGGFPGGVLIEGNYLDYSVWLAPRGYIPNRKENSPEYRPNHEAHETYLGFGIMVMNNFGDVIIRDNIVRNMNARGILVQDNHKSSMIQISQNTVFSDIYGCYPYSLHYAGVGIAAFGSWGFNNSGSNVFISDNDVRCTKLNYCGIAIYGQSAYVEGSGKLGECVVENNSVHLEDGFVGVLIRKNDETEVFGNKISGKAYYGFHLSGSGDRDGFDLSASNNVVKDNDLIGLVVKTSDAYSDEHVDGRMFTGSEGNSKTAHVWLNGFTSRNIVKVKTDETAIDEGKDNIISYN